ncbi:MAG: non-canonical purine NTP pyrophosphatase, RdgB/HAM1 family [Gammaproteobacteria bacterium CG11_big_fil_rev_8_21_14_0_20_46_22]|nr:MAG: non-canonical purine NTP pyrophosphatase, RdgB/HAM1 family [Gammaproteobacteria bacterium CG12_big_fil_rev_8_21_14_0_65_46_12]PIR10971.1 MAG: non-canonical purine NTP pyrophosphatase, RdgB/HAM1 family [Gammaproteobacteria bacterium CG11_big_fil_rev_8_21_14_0_20_46_22]
MVCNAWVLASFNNGKLKEFSELLSTLPVKLRLLSDYTQEAVEETGLSFVENAILKARYAAKCSGLPALADDSGLCVDVLGGGPGIYSARYAGPGSSDKENREKLLSALEGEPQRSACFVCVLAFVRDENDPMPLLAQGVWRGEIAAQALGHHGFGYDPVFYLPALKKTSAELSPQEKAGFSHRGEAVRAFLTQYGDEIKFTPAICI